MPSTSDCKEFIVAQVIAGNISATWACDEDAAGNEVENKYEGDIDHLSEEDWKNEVAETLPILQERVRKALMNPSNWKRRSKYSGTGNVKTVREFMCDTRDNMFDGMVGYEVVEMTDGSLRLGEEIGD